MHARVARFAIPPDRIDEDVRVTREAVSRAMRTFPGALGPYYLVDRDSGQSMAVTLWEDEETMRRSEVAAAEMRDQTTAEVGATVLSIEHFEVALQPSDFT